jgi:ectoine hydroxylase-related dioxygenase (phytanoyl-CoA dioxygenase family)
MNPKPRIESIRDLSRDLAGRYRSNAPVPQGPPPSEFGTLLEQGYVIFESLLSQREIEQVREGILPLLGPQGRNNFEGERTQRVYAVLAKTRTCDFLVEHPRVLEVLNRLLLPNYLLSQLQVINILPGESPQTLHYDDGFYPVPRPRKPLSAATIWAIDDFTADNGATVVLPKSHTWGNEVPTESAERVPMAMPAGSVVLLLGTLWHGGGANRTDKPRLAVSAQYTEPWTRTQENMFLAVPKEQVLPRSEAMKRMLGYSIHPPFIGMVDGQSPLRILEEPK